MNSEWIEQQRRRWMRNAAHLYVRHDAHRFAPPGAPDAPGRASLSPTGLAALRAAGSGREIPAGILRTKIQATPIARRAGLGKRSESRQMTVATAHVRVLNSLLFIQAANTKELPAIDGNGSLWRTATCIAVSCMPDCDGITEVTFADSADLEKVSGTLLLDDFLETPSRRIDVTTVLAQTILQQHVSGMRTHVRIWTNGLRDTDRVIIGLV